MQIVNINILLSTGIFLKILLWCLAPPTPVLVELFIVLQISSYTKDTLSWTGTSPWCRSAVFPSVYQYTMQCLLRTAVIISFISRYSSVKCSSSKPCFRMSLHVTLCEHRMKL